MPKEIWNCAEISEPLCCGIPVLGDFSREDDDSPENTPRPKTEKLLKLAPEIGQLLGDRLKKLKGRKQYFCAYIPDLKSWEPERVIFETAGFKRGVSLKSKHGRYTNTRWEWFSPSYKGTERETAVSTYPV